MKKIIALFLVLTMVLTFAACGSKPTEEPSNSVPENENVPETENTPENSEPSQPDSEPTSDTPAPEGAVTDETKLGEAIAYRVDSKGHVIISVKTSAYIKSGSGWLGICPLGIYLTEESADAADSYYEYFDSSYDKEWFDGIYTFALNNESIVPDTYTMVLCDDDDSGNVIGEWIFNKDKSGNIEIGFDNSWLRGAGEDRKVEEFDSVEDEIASWFTFNAYNEDWSEFFFDGYYLEETDPEGYDKYYLMICPEGDYVTYEEADAVDLTYSEIAEKCPYKFSLENYCVPDLGKYTMVLAKMGGDVEVQFTVKKTSATEWTMDFSNAKCTRLSDAE